MCNTNCFIYLGSCDDLRAENNSFIEVPCAPGVPPSATYLLIHKIELHLYLKLTWLPCQTSLYLLKGFEVSLLNFLFLSMLICIKIFKKYRKTQCSSIKVLCKKFYSLNLTWEI